MKSPLRLSACWAVLLSGLLALGGCSGNSTNPGGVKQPETPPADDHGHDHSAHAHSDTGPHDGHILETSDDDFHAEWTHSDDGRVTVYILDSEAAVDRPISAASIIIETAIAGGSVTPYELKSLAGEEKSAAFEITDLALLTVLKVAADEGVTATLKFSAEGKDVTAKIQHEDHGHAH
jgi:hypothetical protein